MPFCPECKIEYREGFTTCSDCRVALVDELPEEKSDPREEHTDEALEVVFITRDQVEVEIIRGILDAAEIACYVTPDAMRYSHGMLMGGVSDALRRQEISVLESQADEARAAIQSALESGETLSPE